jgi:hypothetical protein
VTTHPPCQLRHLGTYILISAQPFLSPGPFLPVSTPCFRPKLRKLSHKLDSYTRFTLESSSPASSTHPDTLHFTSSQLEMKFSAIITATLFTAATVASPAAVSPLSFSAPIPTSEFQARPRSTAPSRTSTTPTAPPCRWRASSVRAT